MKKATVLVIAIAACFSLMISCEKSETYADKVRKERRAISHFIDERGINTLDQYPKNGVFAENEFFLEPVSGIYFHVVDSGNGRKATTGRVIDVRYKEAGSIISQPTFPETNNDGKGNQDILTFTYEDPSTYIDSQSNTYSGFAYKSPGIIVPLQYVGDNAIIKIIVPFKSGSGLQQITYEPVYIGHLAYDFREEQGE